MSVTNQLKKDEQASMTLALAYGRHVGKGHLTMSTNVGGADPNHQIKFRQALCEGTIESIDAVYYAGTAIAAASYTLYPGDQVTSPPAPFDKDFAHFGTAMLNVTLPVGMADADDSGSPPDKLAAFGKFLKVKDYDSVGAESAAAYSVSPARVVSDMIVTRGRLGTTIINWSRWNTWKTYNGTNESVDYTTLTDFDGIGLKGSYYNGTAFNTLVGSRTDPSIYFDTSSGAPMYGQDTDNFSVRWEGKIRAKATGTYTFTMAHDDSIKLWVGDLTTALIDQATAGNHSATKALTANTLYDIKIEWTDTTGDARCIMYWTPPTEAEQTVPQEYLYPKAENKPRYETHALFETPTTLDDGVRHVLAMCNSFVQQADGKLNFYNYEELGSTPSFAFNSTNIKDGTLKFYRRDSRDLRNRFEAVFRDLESQYLEVADPPVVREYPQLQDDQGRVIDGIAIDLDSTIHWQAYKVLKHYGKFSVDMNMFAEFDGNGLTYKVLPGDLVSIAHTTAGWPVLLPKTFIVLEAVDYSPETSPDRRGFICMEWSVGGGDS